MSKISLTPNDSGTGTFTIQSPDSNTNRTLTLPDAAGELMTYVTAAGLSNRRLNLNGAMNVAQRGTSTTADGYLVDRWRVASLSTDDLVHTYSQSTDAPAGFSNSFKINVDTAETTLDADESWKFEQRFEGQDLQMLAKGTSDAKALTVSFWVKSSTTGTYICELDDRDNTRAYSQAYTINSADTWEYKTLTYAGDTAGALDNDNEQSFRLAFFLAAGSDYTSGTLTTGWTSQVDADRLVGQTNLMAAVNNYWQITGVQLEAGSVATPFEHRSYGDELARCRRYAQFNTAEFLETYNTTGGSRQVTLSPPMRANPTTSLPNGGTNKVLDIGIGYRNIDSLGGFELLTNHGGTQVTNISSSTANHPHIVTGNCILYEAEL